MAAAATDSLTSDAYSFSTQRRDAFSWPAGVTVGELPATPVFRLSAETEALVVSSDYPPVEHVILTGGVLSVTPRDQPVPRGHEVLGAVLEIDDGLVRCALDEGGVFLNVPVDVFPSPPIYGARFSLSVDRTGRYRKPKIVIIPETPEAVARRAEILADIEREF